MKSYIHLLYCVCFILFLCLCKVDAVVIKDDAIDPLDNNFGNETKDFLNIQLLP